MPAITFLVSLLVVAGSAAQLAATDRLFQAIRSGDTGAVRRLLDGGASPDARDGDGIPALMAATLRAGADCMKLLLDRGANPDATNSAGATALMWAVPDLERVRLLVARGANVNAKSSNLGRTPLLIAASYPGSVELLRILLDKGAELHVRERNGTNALGCAVRWADVDVVRFLVDRGMDVNDAGAGSATALDRALRRRYQHTIDYLMLRCGKIGRNSLLFSTHWLDPGVVRKLLGMGADVNAREETFGRTPLINAAASEQANIETLKLLLENRADPNLADTDGETALDWATHGSHAARIKVLQQYHGKAASTPRDKTYAAPEGVADAQTAVARSVALLLPTAPVVFQKRACISCHQQSMPAQVAAAAREKGIPVNEEIARKNLQQIISVYVPIGEEALQGVNPPGGVLTVGYIVMALAAERHPLDKVTAALMHLAVNRQMADGSWLADISRPPMEESSISHTVMGVRTLYLYPMAASGRQIGTSLRRAQSWLLAARPRSAEDAAMRLMGLAWTKAARRDLDRAAQEWIAQQRDDGGWAQLPHLSSDAYATGISLYALNEAGIAVTDPAYRKGAQFLLRNQYRDGSWLVKTRSFPVQKQFESGYPFGMNQWISAAGACWASLTLARTLPDAKSVHAARAGSEIAPQN
jgi:ankyrin repeat protein